MTIGADKLTSALAKAIAAEAGIACIKMARVWLSAFGNKDATIMQQNYEKIDIKEQVDKAAHLPWCRPCTRDGVQ